MPDLRWMRPPGGVNLTALPIRLVRICCKAPASPRSAKGVEGSMPDQAFQLTRHAAAHGHIANAQDHFIKHERAVSVSISARFDLGEVQRVVDDVEQGRRTGPESCADGLRGSGLFFR